MKRNQGKKIFDVSHCSLDDLKKNENILSQNQNSLHNMRLIYYGQNLQIIKRKKRDARLPSSSMTNGTKVYWSWGRLPEYQEHSTPQTKEMELQTMSEMIKKIWVANTGELRKKG